MVALFETIAAKRASVMPKFFLMMAPLRFYEQRVAMENSTTN
jgi:hypothetical protein